MIEKRDAEIKKQNEMLESARHIDGSAEKAKKKACPEIKLIMKVRDHLREIIEKSTKSYENDPDTLKIRCPKNHLLYREYGMPDNLVDDDHVPKCFKCKQENLPSH